jgi:predicted esterase
MLRAAFFHFLIGLVGLATARAEGPYPVGRTETEMEGLKTTLLVPDQVADGQPASLILLLHGLGDSGANLANSLVEWVEQGYLVCAPSSTGRAWSLPDVKAVARIGKRLIEETSVDPDRVHVVGFSNGGWNLSPLAFHDKLKPRSATWIAAGYNGGKVPGWAKKRLGAIALAGEQDPNAAAAKSTVTQLSGKVRCVEVRLQPDLGHKWPREHMDYLQWWMGVQEGRFEPGYDFNFEWGDDLDAALGELKGAKRGGVLVYVYSPEEDKDKPESIRLQGETFMDPKVRHFGGQLKAVLLEMGERAKSLGVKATPAVVVLKRDGSVKKLYSGKIKARSLATALRSVAPDRSMPKD